MNITAEQYLNALALNIPCCEDCLELETACTCFEDPELITAAAADLVYGDVIMTEAGLVELGEARLHPAAVRTVGGDLEPAYMELNGFVLSTLRYWSGSKGADELVTMGQRLSQEVHDHFHAEIEQTHAKQARRNLAAWIAENPSMVD